MTTKAQKQSKLAEEKKISFLGPIFSLVVIRQRDQTFGPNLGVGPQLILTRASDCFCARS